MNEYRVKHTLRFDKEYRVRYALLTAAGRRFESGIVVKTLKEVSDAITQIENVGYEFLGVDSRIKGHYQYIDEGWK